MERYTCVDKNRCVSGNPCVQICVYGVASVSRIDKIIGLFLQKSPIKESTFCKRGQNFIDPTDRSQPIPFILRRERSTCIDQNGFVFGNLRKWICVYVYIEEGKIYVHR